MDFGRGRFAFGLGTMVLACVLAASPALARYASIVVDADSGRVLHAKNADTRNHPASLTKLMTLYLAFEALDAGRLRLDQAARYRTRRPNHFRGFTRAFRLARTRERANFAAARGRPDDS